MIIGVCGFAGSGKDIVADYLADEHGFYKTSFASVLKEAAGLVFKFSVLQLYGPSKEREKPDPRYPFTGICPTCRQRCDYQDRRGGTTTYPHTKTITDPVYVCTPCQSVYETHVTPRLALQTLGTEWGRTLYADIWVNATINHIKEHQKDYDKRNWVISDVRFQNEVDAIKAQPEGVVMRLLRGEQLFTHASEAGIAAIDLDKFDHVIDNHGSLEDLYEAVRDALPKFQHLTENT